MSWSIDYTHSHVQFSVRHLMVSTVRGQFDHFKGVIQLDDENPAATTVDVQIDANSINTGLHDRDEHLRSPDFLDAASHPTILFKSRRIERLDQNRARLIGDLTIRDVTRQMTLDVTYQGQVKSPFGPFVSTGFSARGRINRKDWGLSWNALIESGGVAVGNDIDITIDVELTKPIEVVEAEEANPAVA